MDLSTLMITPELLRCIAGIDEFNGGWKVQRSLHPDYCAMSPRLRVLAPPPALRGQSSRTVKSSLYWVRESLEDKSYHPLIVIAVFNVVFLAIHPFQDGNGRLSLVLVSLFMLKAGYTYIPYASLESTIEKNKDAYYLALQRTQKTLQGQADWLPWLNFFLRSLKRQKDHLKTKIPAIANYSHLPQESVLILQYLDAHARMTISDAYGLITSVSRPTVKNRMAELVKLGYIERHGKARASWYSKSLDFQHG